MKFYIVHFVHHNVDLWHRHLEAHVNYLKQAVADGILRASGPLRETGSQSRQGFLIMACRDRDELIARIAADPFHVHGVIDEFTFTEWDPIFGCFSSESSGQV